MEKMDELLDKVSSEQCLIGDAIIIRGLARSPSFRIYLKNNFEIHHLQDGSDCLYSIQESRYLMRYKEFHRTDTNKKGVMTGIIGIEELPLEEK